MTDNDIDAIRQRADRYKQTGAGSGKTIQAIQLANTDVPALLAKVDELTAELDEWRGRYELAHADRLARSLERDQTIDEREYLKAQLAARDAQLTQSREQAATYANEIGTLTAENARLRQQRDGLVADLTDAGNEVDLLTAETTRLRPVVDAAKTWRFSGDTAGDHRRAIAALNSAVDALPKAEATR